MDVYPVSVVPGWGWVPAGYQAWQHGDSIKPRHDGTLPKSGQPSTKKPPCRRVPQAFISTLQRPVGGATAWYQAGAAVLSRDVWQACHRGQRTGKPAGSAPNAAALWEEGPHQRFVVQTKSASSGGDHMRRHSAMSSTGYPFRYTATTHPRRILQAQSGYFVKFFSHRHLCTRRRRGDG